MLWPLLFAAVCSLLAVMIGVVRSEGLRRSGAANSSDIEQFLNQLADDDCCISFTADDRQHVTWVSESFLQVVGRPSVECIGRNLLDVLQDDGRDTALFIRFGEALCEQRQFTGELHLTSASGDDFWLELVVRPLHDPQGILSGWMGFGRLCTERKQGEELVTCSQAKSAALIDELRAEIAYRTQSEATPRGSCLFDVYRMIVDHHAIVAETDTRGIIVSVNDAFCRISGYSREELIGRNHRILNSGVHPKSMWQDM
ncbi:MAG: PAS domain S-box protein [Pirellulales bacterium]